MATTTTSREAPGPVSASNLFTLARVAFWPGARVERDVVNMRKLVVSLGLILGMGGAASAAQMQGLLVAQSCVEDIVKNGHEATLQRRPDCSLRNHYARPTYALVTDSKHYFTFDPAGNKKALQLLKGSPHPDELKVVVTGEVSGNTIQVKYMTIL